MVPMLITITDRNVCVQLPAWTPALCWAEESNKKVCSSDRCRPWSNHILSFLLGHWIIIVTYYNGNIYQMFQSLPSTIWFLPGSCQTQLSGLCTKVGCQHWARSSHFLSSTHIPAAPRQTRGRVSINLDRRSCSANNNARGDHRACCLGRNFSSLTPVSNLEPLAISLQY